MPPWPGGECPVCSERMPENLVHCQVCRALLNPDLESDSVEIPQFVPLREIATVPENLVSETDLRGFYIPCPHCEKQLRTAKKYLGQNVQCRFCAAPFQIDPNAATSENCTFFAMCPHCDKELKAATKYMGVKVACKFCEGELRVVDPVTESVQR